MKLARDIVFKSDTVSCNCLNNIYLPNSCTWWRKSDSDYSPDSRMSAPVRFRGVSVRPGWDPGPRFDYPKSMLKMLKLDEYLTCIR